MEHGAIRQGTFELSKAFGVWFPSRNCSIMMMSVPPHTSVNWQSTTPILPPLASIQCFQTALSGPFGQNFENQLDSVPRGHKGSQPSRYFWSEVSISELKICHWLIRMNIKPLVSFSRQRPATLLWLQFFNREPEVSWAQIACDSWRREWQPTPVFLPGESDGQRSWRLQPMEWQRVGHDKSTWAQRTASHSRGGSGPGKRESWWTHSVEGWGKKALICWFPWCKYFYYDQLQAADVKLEKDEHTWLGMSQL